MVQSSGKRPMQAEDCAAKQHSAESLHQGSHKGSLAKAQAAEALRCAGLHTAHVEVTFEGELLLFIRWDDPWGGFGQERYYLSDEDTMICVRPLAVCSDLLRCWQHTGLGRGDHSLHPNQVACAGCQVHGQRPNSRVSHRPPPQSPELTAAVERSLQRKRLAGVAAVCSCASILCVPPVWGHMCEDNTS